MTFDNRAHKINYKRWHKCDRCKIFTLFDDEPSKTMFVCPDCWKVWKDLPQYRVTNMAAVKAGKKIKHKAKEEFPIEYMLIYGLGCSLCLLIIAYYLFYRS